MTTIRDQVIEFHKEFQSEQGHGEGPPHVPIDKHVRLRLRLVFEEAFELLDACTACNADAYQKAEELVAKLIDEPICVDIVKVADALADIDYVVEGSRIAFGIHGEPIAAEVHRSNMSKKGGHRDPGGKWKPPTYSRADVAGELKKQGWNG